MYDFTDTIEPAKNKLGLQTLLNGTALDTNVKGFKTLNVTGRGIAERALLETAKPHADGSWVDGVRVPARDIIVEASISASTESELQDAFATLNRLLDRRHAPTRLSFTDDPDYYWLGYFTTWNAPKEDRRRHVIELIFRRHDPYKYKTVPDTISAPSTVELAYNYPTTPELVVLTVGATDTRTLKLTNATTGASIVLSRDTTQPAYTAGSKYTIRYTPHLTAVAATGADVMPDVDLASDIELFTVSRGDVLTTQGGTASLTIRGKDL